MLEDVSNPLGIPFVGFLAPNRLDVFGMSQNDIAGRLQNVVNGNPMQFVILYKGSLFLIPAPHNSKRLLILYHPSLISSINNEEHLSDDNLTSLCKQNKMPLRRAYCKGISDYVTGVWFSVRVLDFRFRTVC